MNSKMIFARNFIARAAEEEVEAKKIGATSVPGAIVGYIIGSLGGALMVSVVLICLLKGMRRRKETKRVAAEKAATVSA